MEGTSTLGSKEMAERSKIDGSKENGNRRRNIPYEGLGWQRSQRKSKMKTWERQRRKLRGFGRMGMKFLICCHMDSENKEDSGSK